MQTAHHAYRPDIDGLRAIAVGLVLIFHAFPDRLPGGFVGVDIFFVISGFLISGIIFSDLRRERFSFRNFYARRIRRIFPALIVVLAATLLAGWFLLLPDEYLELGKHIAGGAGFVSNLVLLNESGYFDTAAELKPLLHLWSLGIEEQFYFIWPLLVWVAWGRRFTTLGLILLLLAGSFALNVERVHAEATSTYYLPFTRFWELMIGCALAYATHLESVPRWLPGDPQRIALLRNIAAWSGAAAVLAAAALLDKGRDFPGWWALLPTCGAFLLIAAGPAAWVNRICLAHPAMVLVGLISFPLYLWHWPLLAFPRITSIDPPSALLRAGALALSLLLAWLTWRLIERPIRFHNRHPRLIAVLAGLMALLLVAGSVTFAAAGIPARMRERAEYSAFFGDWVYTKSHDLMANDRHECNFYDILARKIKPAIDPACYTPRTRKAVFLWGDSHVQHLNYGLREALPPDISLLEVSASGCPPYLGERERDYSGTCNRANRFALEKIAEVRPDTVILAQSIEHEKTDFDALAARLKQAGVRQVILLGPVPHWWPQLFKVMLKNYWGAIPARLKEHLNPSVLETDRILKARYAHSAQLTYISLVDHLCNVEGCLTYVDGDPKEGLITYDDGHFTLPASRYVVGNFVAPVVTDQITSSP